MKRKLLYVKWRSAVWLCRFFCRLADYFFDVGQAANNAEWVARTGRDLSERGWPAGIPDPQPPPLAERVG